MRIARMTAKHDDSSKTVTDQLGQYLMNHPVKCIKFNRYCARKIAPALQIPYLSEGATKHPVFSATFKAMYSGWMLSVHRGRGSPCSSTLPMGKITIASSFAAWACLFGA
jgi:hypothetical protein